MSNFGEAKPKKDGEMVAFDIGDLNLDMTAFSKGSNTDYTYVERRVPVDLEDKVHNLIDQFLKANGYDTEQI